MKKIIYIMNVEWNWIKQRPHFIAEYLDKDYEVYIIYQYKYNRKGLQNREENLNLIPIKTIPKISGIRQLKWINDIILTYKSKKIIESIQPDYIYLTFPTQVDVLTKKLKGKVLYDCMDNNTAFTSNVKEREKLKKKEKRLIDAANNVLVSSEYLKRLIVGRYQADGSKISLIRNAFDGNILKNVKDKSIGNTFKMAYIGTISTWFDWETMITVLKKMPSVEIHLYGPIDRAVNLPKNERILYHGTVEHDKIYDAIKDKDCLIMPFVINEIINAVDPVKIYEYINFNKDIIMCYYDEVRRFDNYVYFYKSADEFINAIESVKKNKSIKYNREQRESFLNSNNWFSRVKQIEKILEE